MDKKKVTERGRKWQEIRKQRLKKKMWRLAEWIGSIASTLLLSYATAYRWLVLPLTTADIWKTVLISLVAYFSISVLWISIIAKFEVGAVDEEDEEDEKKTNLTNTMR